MNRTEFEKYANGLNLRVKDNGNYSDRIVHNMWLTWQAASKHKSELSQQLEESNDCMLALADTLAKYGHNTHDLLEQVKWNEFVLAKARGE